MRRNKTTLAIYTTILSILLSYSFGAMPAAAQMDWMKAGKDLLGTARCNAAGHHVRPDQQ